MADGGTAEDSLEMTEAQRKISTSAQPAAVDNHNAQPLKSETLKKSSKKKVEVLLKAAGDAPIMVKKKWVVDGSKQVSYIVEFIRKYIKCEPQDSLFVYVGQCFAPTPDQTLQNLYDCFGADGKLVLHYCKTQAWG
ncbi:autophagy protein 12-like [Stylophora pistillata]|uniref:Ubiquitin-like protein ATG12 n=1 Tax=Stylophora pistillata TaxID=50429 RepID=A0A2B4S298_STYPI|nr:autophagy protein 12-like [Stylophora pistillata]PFX22632.1 Ubiquitin-like protein ATG12 [Stylophora pistillata]